MCIYNFKTYHMVFLSATRMAILPHHNPTLRPLYHSRLSHHISLSTRIYCSTTTTPTKPHRDQIIKPPTIVNPPSALVQNVATVNTRPVLNDPTLQSTWSHRVWLASGCTTVLISLAKSITTAVDSHLWIEPILASFIGYILADLGSGIYHWGIDNYGHSKTPFFGTQIEAFQGHHKWPWTITRRQFANNLHALARAVTFTVLPFDLICNDDAVLLGFVGVCSGCIMFSQQFHAWAHSTKSKLPVAVVALQDAGILVSRSQHAAHHRQPYNNNYCIVSGVWNEFLDNSKFFEALEMLIFFKLGVRPRSWTEPNSEWAEETESALSQL